MYFSIASTIYIYEKINSISKYIYWIFHSSILQKSIEKWSSVFKQQNKQPSLAILINFFLKRKKKKILASGRRPMSQERFRNEPARERIAPLYFYFPVAFNGKVVKWLLSVFRRSPPPPSPFSILLPPSCCCRCWLFLSSFSSSSLFSFLFFLQVSRERRKQRGESERGRKREKKLRGRAILRVWSSWSPRSTPRSRGVALCVVCHGVLHRAVPRESPQASTKLYACNEGDGLVRGADPLWSTLLHTSLQHAPLRTIRKGSLQFFNP